MYFLDIQDGYKLWTWQTFPGELRFRKWNSRSLGSYGNLFFLQLDIYTYNKYSVKNEVPLSSSTDYNCLFWYTVLMTAKHLLVGYKEITIF